MGYQIVYKETKVLSANKYYVTEREFSQVPLLEVVLNFWRKQL